MLCVWRAAVCMRLCVDRVEVSVCKSSESALYTGIIGCMSELSCAECGADQNSVFAY
jgi:hypothetical protein